MKIVKGYPPNHAEIVEMLHPAPNYIFTYGDTVFSPTTDVIPPDILAHESVHERQQTSKWHFSPTRWWKKYLIDPQFRYEQELEAYQAQYQFVKAHVRDRNMVHKLLHEMGRALSSANYGNVVGFSEAVEKIKNNS